MTLDWKVCSRARLSRDPRFDGKFFIGVRGSGVYCRSICPAPTAKEENCRYFPTAAAAAEAGFRPCLRCRPESSPGTPAWLGTSSTVSRALRLIGETGLDEAGIEGLAARLGVGSRHLRRLFIRHLGAAPNVVAQTRRLHFAKKLLDETNLSMGQVALAAGFGCVRRFNAAIRDTYRRTPTQIRRLARQRTTKAEHHYVFHLRFRPPYQWQAMLTFLAAHATPGVETVEFDAYSRSICLNGVAGHFRVAFNEAHDSLEVRLQFGEPRSLFFIIERIRTMFDLNADWTDIAIVLKSDPMLRRFVESSPGLRLPGCWDGFELAVRALLEQGTRLHHANALAERMVGTLGPIFQGTDSVTHIFPTAEILVKSDLSGIGLSKLQQESIRALSRAVCDERISFSGHLEAAEFLQQLMEIRGVGKQTARYVGMRALGDPDAFPIRGSALSVLNVDTVAELESRAEAWRPWRAYGALYLWKVAGEQTRGTKHSRSRAEHSNSSQNGIDFSACPDGIRDGATASMLVANKR